MCLKNPPSSKAYENIFIFSFAVICLSHLNSAFAIEHWQAFFNGSDVYAKSANDVVKGETDESISRSVSSVAVEVKS